MAEGKNCTKCNNFKALTEYSPDKRASDGRSSSCRYCGKEYREANREKKKLYDKEYRGKNSEKIKAKNEANKNEKKEYNRQYSRNNRESINKKRRERLRLNPLSHLSKQIRDRTYIAFSKKGYKRGTLTHQTLIAEWCIVKEHIEKQFKPGMSWGNYGEWHVDHVIPLSIATTLEELLLLGYYENLQPLWPEENRKKGNKYE